MSVTKSPHLLRSATASDHRPRHAGPRAGDGWGPAEVVAERSAALQADLARRASLESVQRLLETRQRLPCWEMREELLAKVREHQVVVVSGETGEGWDGMS